MDIAHHRTIYDMPLTIMAMCSSLSMFYCFHYNSNVKNLIHRRVHRLHWSLQVLQQTFSRMFNNKCKQNRCTWTSSNNIINNNNSYSSSNNSKNNS